MNKIVELELEIADIQARKQEQMEKIAQIKNQALQVFVFFVHLSGFPIFPDPIPSPG